MLNGQMPCVINSVIMIPASTYTPISGSSLVRFLSDLNVTDVQVSHKHFAERLGQLIDLSKSVALSAAHKSLQNSSFEQNAISSSAIIDEYVEVRESIVHFISASFVENSDTNTNWLILPTIAVDLSFDEGTAFEPFKRFYATHQREMDFKLKKLRTSARTALSGVSPKLSQLAALDGVIDDTLANHARKLLSSVPNLLERRFKLLHQNHILKIEDKHIEDDPQLWTEAGGWLEVFINELQGLLLAELEIRLEPVLGLIEALNEEVARIYE